MAGKQWHPEEVKILVLMFEKGCSIEEMAEVFQKRSLDAIKSKLRSMGYKASKRPYQLDINIDALRRILSREDFSGLEIPLLEEI